MFFLLQMAEAGFRFSAPVTNNTFQHEVNSSFDKIWGILFVFNMQ